MRHTLLTLTLAGTLALAATTASGQATPPPLPGLTSEQATRVNEETERYKREVDQRLARGEITPDEAQRLLAWHQWQYAQQLAGSARGRASSARPPDVPPDYVPPPRTSQAVPYYAAPESPPVPYYAAPAPYYGAPYPYYAYPAPYYLPPRGYWGPTVCAGGFGRHSFARFCL